MQSLDIWTPGPGEILIKNVAIASNPVDWKVQKWGFFVTFPCTIGSDVAGTVEAVGDGVTRFKKGDKVRKLFNNKSSDYGRCGAGPPTYSANIKSTAAFSSTL